MAGSTLQQLTRAVSPHCLTPAQCCILIHPCALMYPDCHAALASAPAVDGLHVAHRWLADMIVHLSLDVKPYSSVKQVGQLCTSRQHTDIGFTSRSCRLGPLRLSSPQWSKLTFELIGCAEPPLCTRRLQSSSGNFTYLIVKGSACLCSAAPWLLCRVPTQTCSSWLAAMTQTPSSAMLWLSCPTSQGLWRPNSGRRLTEWVSQPVPAWPILPSRP